MTPEKYRHYRHNTVTKTDENGAKTGAQTIIGARRTPNDTIFPTGFARIRKPGAHLVGMEFYDTISLHDTKYRVLIYPPPPPHDSTPGGYSASNTNLWLGGITPPWYGFGIFSVISVIVSFGASPCSNHLSLNDNNVKYRHEAVFSSQSPNWGFSTEDFQNKFPVFSDTNMTLTGFFNIFLTLCKPIMTVNDGKKMTVNDGKSKMTVNDSKKMTVNDGKYFVMVSGGDPT